MSSSAKGKSFARAVGKYLGDEGLAVDAEYVEEVGLNSQRRKEHRFDFGNDEIIVECKDYQWTEGNNVPSAKISTLNEAMLYLYSAPTHYRKMLFLARTERQGARNETFAEYYWRLHGHFVHDDIELYEFDRVSMTANRMNP